MRAMARVGTSERARSGEGGFALIAALLALVGLTALATAGFLVSSSDHRVAQNQRATITAFYAADAALWTYLATQRGTPGVASYSLAGGTANVSALPLNEPAAAGTDRLYLVRAHGTHLPPEGGRSVRTVGTVALTTPFEMEVPGALASGVGITKNGDSGELNGNDEADASECPVGGQPAKPGVAVPPGGYEQSGGDPVPEGDPPIHEEDPQTLLESTGLDWEGILDGSVLTPDFHIPPDAWPDFSSVSSDDWPVTFVDKDWHDVGPTDDGRGILIVRGDLMMNGNFRWDGIILVGGAIVSDGNQTVRGGAVTGLNLLLGETPNETDLGNGTKTFRYHSCNVYEALSALNSLSAQPGSWFETM